MANKLLELRHWAVESSDEKEAILRHKDGHEMRVAIKALPRLQQEQIKRIKMDAGGEVEYGSTPPGENSLEQEKLGSFKESIKAPSSSPDSPPGLSRLPSGDYLENRTRRVVPKEQVGYPTGGKVEEPDTMDINEQTRNTSFNPRVEQLLSDSEAEKSSVPSHDTHITINTAPPPTSSAPTPPQVSAQVPASPPVNPVAQQQQPSPQVTGQDARQEQVGAYQEAIGKMGDIAQQQLANKNDVRKHVDEFGDYLRNNPINPLAYQESQSAEQKSDTALGLMLGGIGGGGHGNVALDFLNKQIDRNVAAQEKNAENRNTLWGAYQHLYEDNNVSTNLARASMLDILDNKIKLAAIKIGTPQAQKNAQAFSVLAQQEKEKAIDQAAQSLTQKQTFMQRREQESKNLEAFKQSPIKSLLRKGAEQSFQGLQFNPLAEKDYPATVSQYTAAQQADKALANLQPTFNKLVELRTASGRLGRDVSSHLSGLPFGAGEILGGPTKLITDTLEPKNREYESVQSQLLSDLSNAFKGTNVSGEEIRNVINKNSPVYGDTAEMLKQKRDTIEGFIRRAIPTSLLQKYQLSED